MWDYVVLVWHLLFWGGALVLALWLGLFVLAPMTIASFTLNNSELVWWGLYIWVLVGAVGVILHNYVRIRGILYGSSFLYWVVIVLAAMAIVAKLLLWGLGVY